MTKNISSNNLSQHGYDVTDENKFSEKMPLSKQENIEASSQFDSSPWVERYRPKKMENIVLNNINRNLFKNILEKQYFPNILFYGPPGTGKTTTIINLIKEYQQLYNGGKNNVIHLNASDERGIGIIRDQINIFVNSNNMFDKGMKFVILDEVDYMTKNAQQALKYLLQTSNNNVRYCLICNYISKIDESLQSEFICVRFNQLPKEDVLQFLKKITEKENISVDENVLSTIRDNYGSDIRSMINFLQLNQNLTQWKNNILDYSCFDMITSLMKDPSISVETIIEFIKSKSVDYNTDKYRIIGLYLYYITRHSETSNQHFSELLNISEIVVHNHKTEICFNYFCHKIKNFFNKIQLQN